MMIHAQCLPVTGSFILCRPLVSSQATSTPMSTSRTIPLTCPSPRQLAGVFTPQPKILRPFREYAKSLDSSRAVAVSATRHQGSAAPLCVPHPQVGLHVAAAVTLSVNVHQVESARHDVRAGLREGHPRPALPLGNSPGHDHRPGSRAENLSAEPLVGADPRVHVQAVTARPPGEVRHRNQRVTAL